MVISRDVLGASVDTAPIGSTPYMEKRQAASAALRELLDPKTAGKIPAGTAERLGFRSKQNRAMTKTADAVHTALATRFNSEILAPDRDSVLKELLDGKQSAFGEAWDLSLLLAMGTEGPILHTLLDPGQFVEKGSSYSFCRLRAFVSLLLEIAPSLLSHPGKKGRMPLHCLIFPASSEEEVAASTKRSKEAIVAYLCSKEGPATMQTGSRTRPGKDARLAVETLHKRRTMPGRRYLDSSGTESISQAATNPCAVFGGICAGPDAAGQLCCTRDSGLRDAAALSSLKVKTSMENGMAFHAVHAAIAEDIAFPEKVVEALNADSSNSCYYMLDSLGQTCLHLAVSLPFTSNKIRWAKMLGRMCPELLEKACTFFVGDRTDRTKTVTPLQYLAEQRNFSSSSGQPGIKVPPYRPPPEGPAGPHIASWEEVMAEELVRLEGDLKLKCLSMFEDSETCRRIMYTDRNGSCQRFLLFPPSKTSYLGGLLTKEPASAQQSKRLISR